MKLYVYISSKQSQAPYNSINIIRFCLMKTEDKINLVYEIGCEIVRTSILDKLVDASYKG